MNHLIVDKQIHSTIAKQIIESKENKNSSQ